MSCLAALVIVSRRAPSSNLPTWLPSWPLLGVFGRSLSARTSLRVRGFAGAGGVVAFGGKRAGGGTFGCSACDVCFIRSAQFSARAQNLMRPSTLCPLRLDRLPPSQLERE